MRHRKAGAPHAAPDRLREAAVFVLFTEHNGVASVLLIRRPQDSGRHRGEWAFPGGVREVGDSSFLDTAYRETEEELGISASAIERWGELEPVATVASGFVVWPFTGRLKSGTAITPSPREVHEVARMPLKTFISLENRRSIVVHRNASVRALHAYEQGGRVIWGATARILAQIFEDQGAPEAANA